MQIIFLPGEWMVVLFVVGWLVFQLGAALLGNRLPARLLNAKWFSARRFETERFYRRLTGVHRWKHLLPDGGAAHKKGFAKRRLQSADAAYLREFILESKRAELVHWLAILPFWVFGLWGPPVVIPIMFVYALAVNLPCIIAQRYNRPRLIRLLMLSENRRSARAN